MADLKIADQTINVLHKSLDLRAQKQQVIAGNIANAETPGYSARKMDFEADLRRAMETPEMNRRTTNPKHFAIGTTDVQSVEGRVLRVQSSTPYGDGNTVSVDDEMFDLAENQLLFEAGSQIIKKKFSMLKYAASDGK